MKITRPLGTNDGGYPYGAFAVIVNDGEPGFAGLGPNMLGSFAVLQDSSNAPWQIDFDAPVKSFGILTGDAPGGTTDEVWLKAWDNNGVLVAETHFKRSPNTTAPTKLYVKTGSGPIYRVSVAASRTASTAGACSGATSCTSTTVDRFRACRERRPIAGILCRDLQPRVHPWKTLPICATRPWRAITSSSSATTISGASTRPAASRGA